MREFYRRANASAVQIEAKIACRLIVNHLSIASGRRSANDEAQAINELLFHYFRDPQVLGSLQQSTAIDAPLSAVAR